MNISFQGKNIEATQNLHEYAARKIERIGKFFDGIIKVEVAFIVEKNPSIQDGNRVEVTIFTNGPVIRGQAASTDMYGSIDIVAGKLERQIKRYKNKLIQRSKQNRKNSENGAVKTEKGSEEQKIVKVKQFYVKPMQPQEATLQMDLLGHDFFVFLNSESEEVNVVYRRRDGNYGLIEPKF
ncbi:MAG: ribosome-associated translation inhibitor RaiA [Actinobacteria bacterium]|nr:ribosome-associated translation inhibitor RaiA [Actinomycetota bacterium]